MPGRIARGRLLPPGPPTRLTPELSADICRAVAEGSYPYTAAAMNGVPETTFKDWLNRGRGGELPWASLVLDLDRAIATSEFRAISRINTAAKRGHYAASQWFLERRFPGHWGSRTEVTVAGDADRPIPIKNVDTSDATMARILVMVQRLRPPTPVIIDIPAAPEPTPTIPAPAPVTEIFEEPR